MAKQRHDLGVQKRLKSLPAMQAARLRRMAVRQRREQSPFSHFFETWLKYNKYRPYYYGDKNDD